MVAEGVGIGPDGNIVGVLLFVDDHGYMNDLEVYAFGGTVDARPTEGRWGKPTIKSFKLAEWEPHAEGIGRTLKKALTALLLFPLIVTACDSFGLAGESEVACMGEARAYSGSFVASSVTTVGAVRGFTPVVEPVRWPELSADSPAFLCYVDAEIAKAPPPRPNGEIQEPFDRLVIGVAGGDSDLIVAGYRENIPVPAP